MSLPQPAPEQSQASAARSAEILSLIRPTFAQKGFDGASMTDLARVAGMSAGNFYRYFPSKLAIVDALVAQDIEKIRSRFEEIVAAPDPMAALRLGIAGYIHETSDDDCRLMAEIAATALRQSEVAATCARVEETAAGLMVEIFALSSQLSPAECQARFTPHARAIALIVRGYFQRSDLEPDPQLQALLLRSINTLLDDIPCLSPSSAQD